MGKHRQRRGGPVRRQNAEKRLCVHPQRRLRCHREEAAGLGAIVHHSYHHFVENGQRPIHDRLVTTRKGVERALKKRNFFPC